MTDVFRFSPRPNRANEILWREWGEEAFGEAVEQGKLVLLSISAVWCHWCHVMDETSYSDESVIKYINQHYVPVRVDNDQRPDINARYNMGGWPTTCFLTPDGDVIYGATYLAPSQMRQLLPRVVEVWRNERHEILKQLREKSAQAESRQSRVHTPLAVSPLPAAEIIGDVSGAIIRNFDPKHGGLGNGQKFPMSDAWELLLAIYAQTQDPSTSSERLLDMVVHTLIAMGTRGMYDLVAGGWFRC